MKATVKTERSGSMLANHTILEIPCSNVLWSDGEKVYMDMEMVASNTMQEATAIIQNSNDLSGQEKAMIFDAIEDAMDSISLVRFFKTYKKKLDLN